MNLSIVSDDVILQEYRKRFSIPVGEEICEVEKAVEHLRGFTEKDRESFLVIYLNGRNAHLITEVLFIGTLTSSAVYPRELVKRVIQVGAAAVVLAHNHPSGNLNPSRADIDITDKLKAACSTIDCALHDHIIITDDGQYSFAEHGLI